MQDFFSALVQIYERQAELLEKSQVLQQNLPAKVYPCAGKGQRLCEQRASPLRAKNHSVRAKGKPFARKKRFEGSKAYALCPQKTVRGKQRVCTLPAINASRKAKDNPFARQVRKKESKKLIEENRKPFAAGNQQIKE